jgi:8-oxo-dGTP pyrophosphatase MutT (NUDIX family)
MKHEFSAGGAVYRKIKDQKSNIKIEWLVGLHSGYHKWVLPKGMIEVGETQKQTAIREVFEETGVHASICREKPLHIESYDYQADYSEDPIAAGGVERRVMVYQESGGKQVWVKKTVTFFLMQYESGDIADHSWEMEDVAWLPYEDVLQKLAFSGEKIALEKAQMSLSEEEDNHEKN